FGGVMVLQQVGDPVAIEDATKNLLGITLLLAAAAMVFKSYLQGRRSAAARRAGGSPHDVRLPLRVRPIPTLFVGVLGGFLVGLTSVGLGWCFIFCWSDLFRG